jgi:hypothetical protein
VCRNIEIVESRDNWSLYVSRSSYNRRIQLVTGSFSVPREHAQERRCAEDGGVDQVENQKRRPRGFIAVLETDLDTGMPLRSWGMLIEQDDLLDMRAID